MPQHVVASVIVQLKRKLVPVDQLPANS